jgi:uncharacterized RDD family membrane protein YckC
MRCPKCHYLSFDPEPRCRNCGYDLEVADADLALRTAEPSDAPMPDLALRSRPPAAVTPLTLEIGRPTPDAIEDAHEPRLTLDAPPVSDAPRAPARAPHTTAELPLFVRGMADRETFADEADLGGEGTPFLPPSRPPLGVRRAAPTPAPAPPVHPADVPIVRAPATARRLGPLDRDLLEDLKRVEREETMRAREDAIEGGLPAELYEDRVRPLRRAGAAAVDVAMLGGIAAFVFWATLKVCAINLSDLDAAALIPLALFIIVMDVTYLLMFTAAGGQTIGKMLMDIRVVGDETSDGEPVGLGQAAWRTGLTVIALGLGWLPALFGRGVALHDRFAHTRVVRA